MTSWLYTLNAEAGDILWQREIDKTAIGASYAPEFLYYSPDGAYLLLDEPDEIGDLNRNPRYLSPIWRIRADGSGEFVPIVERGFLLGTVPQWEE